MHRYIHINVHIHIHTYPHVDIHVHLHIYIYIHIKMHIQIRIHIHTHVRLARVSQLEESLSSSRALHVRVAVVRFPSSLFPDAGTGLQIVL